MPHASVPSYDPDSLLKAARLSTELLMQQRATGGWWEGELSTSALSTATAVMALTLAEHACNDASQGAIYRNLITGGVNWLAKHQNPDGGWGDTILSVSNISTSMLVNAVFHATDSVHEFSTLVRRSQSYIDVAGGVDAVLKRYGKDHTFSVPILTHCALAGRVSWDRVIPLPFELSCIPAKFYAAARMPVVSYALPALIAIGQVIFHKRGHWNPVIRWLREASIKPSLKVLERIQPENGGFLEATPLTSFVCMSLLGCGYDQHPVTQRCLMFIVNSVRPDGSWPIDTNLTTWVTTLSVNALAGDGGTTSDITSTTAEKTETALPALAADERHSIREWLLKQQYRVVHPYTNASPGGWSWTDLPGGVPDADDTPGAMLAVLNLRDLGEPLNASETESLQAAAVWLLNLQNRDGGWPTFCKGWGTLPFDRSSNDLTAHVLRALQCWLQRVPNIAPQMATRCRTAMLKGYSYLKKTQRADGSWLPLWFGNQANNDDENPLYGTAKVVLALKDTNQLQSAFAQKAVRWLMANQNSDGGWSGQKGLPASTEETALAVEALVGIPTAESAVAAGAGWLITKVNDGSFAEPAPIGFYFAKLWYFERLYPIIFTVAALRRCVQNDE